MKHLFTSLIVLVIAFVVYASVDWGSIDLSLSIPSDEKTESANQSNDDKSSSEISDTKDNRLWIDTIMYAKGHAFGFSGDISMWGGWYLDTICVGDDNMLQCDSVGPSQLKLSLVTRELIVDLGNNDVADKIRAFLNPIKGFKRFQKSYEECLDSVSDEEYGTWKYMGEFTFTVDYPDSGMVNAGKINQFICELSGISENEKAKVPGLSAFYAGFNPTKNYRPVYTGNANDMKCLSDFLANKAFENWRRGGEFDMGSSASALSIKPHIITQRYITFGMYEYDRIGTGHGGYTETFHTFDLNNGNELTNSDIFKTQSLNKVKMMLFEVMAKDPKYRVWHCDSISPKYIEDMIEAWQSPNPILEGPECGKPKRDFKFELPEGALTNEGVVFSFQPYEIDCWAAGAYHFIVPYKKLMPYLTNKAKRLINE